MVSHSLCCYRFLHLLCHSASRRLVKTHSTVYTNSLYKSMTFLINFWLIFSCETSRLTQRQISTLTASLYWDVGRHRLAGAKGVPFKGQVDTWNFKIRLICYFKTSVIGYQHRVNNVPETRGAQLQDGGSPTSSRFLFGLDRDLNSAGTSAILDEAFRCFSQSVLGKVTI
jgi:hypothetical protein